ncbi:hypothetical protein EPA93_22245 [Ktedonosporobacter rubrisoli]|uniref:Uncharacterized protein n=1 Tax=Ktedonosporobacter rubrisoli TaxID=2509675 RepID=A0A4P6JSP3_KTERU|nr:hypothetical protein [Ktedonosporobacter rubrisoli]QBD78567.1 hypothetical protein EPA93_22245 [Ktedonosporobacter rubrisoli]
MVPMSAVAGQSLIWKPESVFSSRYVLVYQDALLGRLSMRSWTNAATAETAEGRLQLSTQGIFKQDIVVFDDTGDKIAAFSQKMSKGIVQFADGRMLNWINGSGWGTKKAWADISDVPFVYFESVSFSRQIQVTIAPAGRTISELSLLVVLGMYIITLLNRSSTVAATIR